jgi:hypothetical protein
VFFEMEQCMCHDPAAANLRTALLRSIRPVTTVGTSSSGPTAPSSEITSPPRQPLETAIFRNAAKSYLNILVILVSWAD